MEGKLGDEWMKQVKGGKRTSTYSKKICPECGKPLTGKPHNHDKSMMSRFRKEAADFKRQRIDRLTE